MASLLKRITNAVKTWRLHRAAPLHIEFNLTDHCNLNCKGCTHYAPLAPATFTSLDELRHAASHIAAIADGGLDNVYLIGGEPLLHPQIVDAMTIVRQAFRHTPISLFTNGLLLPRMSDDFWKTCRDADIRIVMTQYPVNFDYDSVKALIHSHGVRCDIYADRSMADSFWRFGLDPKGRQHPRISHFKCINHGCITITGNRIYPCSISACVGHLNAAAGSQFTHRPGDYIEVDDLTSIEQLKRLRDKPVPFCAYCVYPLQSVRYAPSTRNPKEWID